MPRYSPPKRRRGPDDGDPHLAARLLAHTEDTLKEVDEAVGGTPPAQVPADLFEGHADDVRVRQFLYGVTHDLQSPLSAMSLRLGLLERHLAKGDVDGLCKDLTVLSDAYGRMRDLVQGILTYAETGGSAEAEKEVSLDCSVAAALRLFGDEPALRHARLHIGALPVLRGQPQALGRLFQNLIGNALKYRHPDRPFALTIDADRDETGAVVVTVTDNGVGIDPADAASLFAPFVRGNGTGHVPGHGIGLASCARIATDHGATIDAEGRPDRGATFRIRFPAERVVLSRAPSRT